MRDPIYLFSQWSAPNSVTNDSPSIKPRMLPLKALTLLTVNWQRRAVPMTGLPFSNEFDAIYRVSKTGARPLRSWLDCSKFRRRDNRAQVRDPVVVILRCLERHHPHRTTETPYISYLDSCPPPPAHDVWSHQHEAGHSKGDSSFYHYYPYKSFWPESEILDYD